MEVTNFYNYGTMNHIDEGATQINNYYGSSANEENCETEEEDAPVMPAPELLAKAAMAVQNWFWGNSSYAVLFCVCRDYYGYPNNMSMFENEFAELFNDDRLHYKCTPGTIVSAFFNNNYLKLPIEKWKENGAKQRALILVEHFKEALSELSSEG